MEPLEPWSQPPLAAVAAPGTTRPATAPQRHRPPPSPTPPFGGQLRLGADSPGPGAYDVARWPASEASRPACPVRGFVRAGGGGALALAGE